MIASHPIELPDHLEKIRAEQTHEENCHVDRSSQLVQKVSKYFNYNEYMKSLQ